MWRVRGLSRISLSYNVLPLFSADASIYVSFSPSYILIVAGLFETGFAFCLGKMKEATGAEYCWWGAGFLLSLALSMTLLAKATQSLPIGTAYPVWTGIGAVETVLAGILFLNEPATFPRIFFLLLLIGAIVGLKLVGEPH